MATREIQHYEILYYLNTTPGSGTPTYSLVNEGFTSLTKDNNPEMNDQHFIAEKQARTTLQNYAVSWSLDNSFFEGDAVGDFILDLAFREATGNDAASDLVEVHLYGTPRAKRRPVSMAIDSQTVEGGNPLTGTTTVGSDGELEFGTWDEATLTFTPTP